MLCHLLLEPFWKLLVIVFIIKSATAAMRIPIIAAAVTAIAIAAAVTVTKENMIVAKELQITVYYYY